MSLQEPERALAGAPPVGSPLFKVTGTYGTQKVEMVVPYPSSAAQDDRSSPIGLHGTVGQRRVSGLVHGPRGTDERQTAMATFTVRA